MSDRLIARYPSDAWDSGNHLTRFHEAYYECDCEDGRVVCPECHGFWEADGDYSECPSCERGRITCPECDGTGEILVYE